jgi:tRNA threonylcarbamoyladenosine biosynthesis protein TsaB
MTGFSGIGGLLLAIESTVLPGSVAISIDGEIRDFLFSPGDSQYSESFIPLLESMLGKAGASYQELRGVVINRGPGSFTGIRVGISFAYGVARALGIPLFPVVGLDVMAWQAPPGFEMVIPALDARRGEVYTAIYQNERGVYLREGDCSSIDPQNLIYKIVSRKSYLFGPGYLRFKDTFNERGIGPFPGEEEGASILNARSLLEYHIFRGEEEGVSPENLYPLYIRPSEAELKSKRR